MLFIAIFQQLKITFFDQLRWKNLKEAEILIIFLNNWIIGMNKMTIKANQSMQPIRSVTRPREKKKKIWNLTVATELDLEKKRWSKLNSAVIIYDLRLWSYNKINFEFFRAPLVEFCICYIKWLKLPFTNLFVLFLICNLISIYKKPKTKKVMKK